MDHLRLVRCLAVFIGVLVLFSGGFAGRASAQTSVVDNKLGFYADFSRAMITLVNDTFSGNGCGGSFSCGGIIFDSHQSSTATNITVVGNDQGVAGLDTLQNSIVVGNTVDCSHFL